MIHTLLSIDTGVLNFLYAFRTPELTQFFLFITEFGRWQIVFAIVFCISIFLMVFRRYADMAGLFASTFGAGVIAVFLKYMVHRPRPGIPYQAYAELPYYSFPSAHAALSVALYGFCIYLLLQSASTQVRRYLLAALPVLIFLVCFSRLYLGVHYLSDVLAGFLLGGFFVYFGIAFRLKILRQ